MAPKKEEVLLTQEGLNELQAELKRLKGEERQKIAAELEEAISYGDLSENAAYDDAKTKQAQIEQRINELEYMVKHAKLIDDSHGKGKKIRIGATVTLLNVTQNQTAVYKLTGSVEADPLHGKISNESPVGKAILGKNEGEKVNVKTPSGIIEYAIKKVEHK